MTKRDILKTIRQNCLMCNGSSYEVKLCPTEKCPLHPLRFGKDPNPVRRQLTPEQRERRIKQLAESRKNAEPRKQG